jgi:hypothetical protein
MFNNNLTFFKKNFWPFQPGFYPPQAGVNDCDTTGRELHGRFAGLKFGTPSSDSSFLHISSALSLQNTGSNYMLEKYLAIFAEDATIPRSRVVD